MTVFSWPRGLALLATLFFVGSRAPGQEPGDINVFGTDDRQPVTSKQYPWKSVGYLSTGCTGALVGRDLVLTAAHCVLEGTTGKLSAWLTAFYPNRIDAVSEDSSEIGQVWWGTSLPDTYRASDWALIRLKKKLGDKFGWHGVESGAITSTVTLAGYSGDFRDQKTAAAHVGCTIREEVGGLLFHDCDATRGSSGAPIFLLRNNKPYIVALNVAEKRNGGEASLKVGFYHWLYANVAIPASAFVAKVRELQ